jgi:hypothetical protein
VSAFTRTFTWDGGSTVTVADEVTLKSPKAAEWHLQSDTPFTGSGTRFQNGKAGDAAVRVTFVAPAAPAVSAGPATIKAPGPPGSIEKGPEEQRGHVLTARAPAAGTVRFDVTLDVLPPGPAQPKR